MSFPIKNIPNLNIGFLKRAAQDRAREVLRLTEGERLLQASFTQPQASGYSLPEAQSMPIQMRGDYRGHGDPVEPAYEPHKYAGAAQNLSVSEQGIDFIKRHEGFVPYFYNDEDKSNPKKRVRRENKRLKSGTLTIGFGFTLNSFPELEKYFERNMTITEAYEFLNYALRTLYVPKVKEATKGISLTQNQFDALVSIAYNKGQNFLLKTPKGISLIELIRKGDIKSAANFIRTGLDSSDLGNEYPGIPNRRAAEAALFEK